MEKSVATLERGAVCSAWNYCGQRLASGSIDGTLSIFVSPDPSSSSSFSRSFSFKVHDNGILKVVWAPPEFGDAVACILADGTLSLWEEVAEDGQNLRWKFCTDFQSKTKHVLDVQFGVSGASLQLVAAYSDGYVKVYELLNPLELNTWQLQAEFQNVIDSVSKFAKVSSSSASISWMQQRGENQQLSFVLGYNSDVPQLNSSKVWEFDQMHQRWLTVAELASPEESGDPVYAVAWAPNIGRPYEIICCYSKGYRNMACWCPT